MSLIFIFFSLNFCVCESPLRVMTQINVTLKQNLNSFKHLPLTYIIYMCFACMEVHCTPAWWPVKARRGLYPLELELFMVARLSCGC